jgi:hypothetical protein
LPSVATPSESVAVQLTVVVPSGKVLPDAREQTGVIVAPVEDLAEAVYVTRAPFVLVASTVKGPGSISVGGLEAVTVMAKDPLASFPRLSVAVQFTVVVPPGNVLPDCGVQLAATAPSTRSVALTWDT